VEICDTLVRIRTRVAPKIVSAGAGRKGAPRPSQLGQDDHLFAHADVRVDLRSFRLPGHPDQKGSVLLRSPFSPTAKNQVPLDVTSPVFIDPRTPVRRAPDQSWLAAGIAVTPYAKLRQTGKESHPERAKGGEGPNLSRRRPFYPGRGSKPAYTRVYGGGAGSCRLCIVPRGSPNGIRFARANQPVGP
jgi:hypothetical protein